MTLIGNNYYYMLSFINVGQMSNDISSSAVHLKCITFPNLRLPDGTVLKSM